jgi:UDP-glucose 4-epimerase
MCSRGSVIPLFVEQIERRQPLTLTDPTMTRFLMSLAESVGLVEYAFANAEPGDTFVRKAPASTIGDLAIAVCELLGVEANLAIIGTRHGEKVFETLLSREEMAKAEDRGDYYRVPLDARSLDYGLYFDKGASEVDQFHDYTSHNADRLQVADVVELLSQLPEFSGAKHLRPDAPGKHDA